jgi:predicted GH43/DUF377 family glycosyl hydrolase
MGEFKLQRLGILMHPEDGNANEADGVLNPAAVRGKDGQLYIFPRLVAKGNYSRIGIARVKFNDAGDPVGVERLGIALEPEADYEKHPGGGGCEDPRVTYVEPLDHYVMTYVAFSANGPRIAIARSNDLFKWERVGLASFTPHKGIKFEGVDNKDSCVFPQVIPNPHGEPEMALIHRPLFPGTRPEEIVKKSKSRKVEEMKESIWVSYLHLDLDKHTPVKNACFTTHHHLAWPVAEWENLKIGCGTPPVLTKHGWMIIYHGVREVKITDSPKAQLCYSAGVMILDKNNPWNILYRSPKPIITPELPEECVGLIADVVFPTGIDCRDDIGMPNRYDIYYGMADDKIGVARLDIPDVLPG